MQSIDPHLACYREIILHVATQYDYKNTMIKYIANPKIQYNYSNNNCIPELFTVNPCWNGVNILASHKVWYISYVPQFEPLM